MQNPLLLWELAELHQREVEKEIALRQLTNQVKTTTISRLELINRFFKSLRVQLKNMAIRQDQDSPFPDKDLVVSANK
jgi:hypothetical protein